MSYPYGMNPYFMGRTNPGYVIPTGNQDLDQLIAASQFICDSTMASMPPGFGAHNTGNLGGIGPMLNLTDKAMAIAGSNDPSNPYNQEAQGGRGDLPASAGGERSTSRKLMGAGATGLLTAGLAFAAINCWNPAGWSVGAVVGVAAAAGAIAGYFL